MAALHTFRFVRVGLVLGAASLLASSCVVDTSSLIFDDDEYQDALDGDGDGGQAGGSNTGGSGVGGTGLGGLGGLGGATGGGSSTGGMGGDGALCEANDMQCNGKQVELCSGGQWIPIGGECPNACIDGVCTGVCSPGADECLSAIQTQHCNDVGQWEDEFCEFACVGGTCGGVCRPAERDCNGDTRTLCGDDGEWVDQDTCPGDCDNGVCVGACTNGEFQCAGDVENPTSVECNGTSWETSPETPCDFICDELTGECGGECVPFSSNCASSTTVEVCDGTGTYGEPTECPFICDPDLDACGGQCLPGSEKCTGNTIQVCDEDGQWTDSTTCSGNTPLCLEASAGQPECVECAPGAKMCAPSANALMTCNSSGDWPNSGSACPTIKGANTLCWEDSRGTPACVPVSEIECPFLCRGDCPAGCMDSNTRWGCSMGALDDADCSLGLTCVNGSCVK